ncbi:hypothetical protein N9C33_01960 [Crocinitomicaceae bacterium]|jgi:mevalonate kinase|nr:hypothetical protein [Crocinitomicaceae bacterium]
MAQDFSVFDIDRINHINYLMDKINDCSNNIYEALVDREFEDLAKEIDVLESILKEISESIDDEV